MQNRIENDIEKIIEKLKTHIYPVKDWGWEKGIETTNSWKEKEKYDLTNNEAIEIRITNTTEKEMDEWFSSKEVDGDVVYMCNFCEKGFSESINVWQHLINTHEKDIKTFSSDVIDTMDEKENVCLEKMCVDLKSCWCAHRDKEFGQELDERRTKELEKIRRKRN